MLDALLAEARLRWGLDPAAGVQVVTAEGLVAAPIEPSRPLLIVPAAALGPAPEGWSSRRRSPAGTARAVTPRLGSSPACTRPSTPSGGPGSPNPSRSGP